MAFSTLIPLIAVAFALGVVYGRLRQCEFADDPECGVDLVSAGGVHDSNCAS